MRLDAGFPELSGPPAHRAQGSPLCRRPDDTLERQNDQSAISGDHRRAPVSPVSAAGAPPTEASSFGATLPIAERRTAACCFFAITRSAALQDDRMSNHSAAVSRRLTDPDFMMKLLRRSFLVHAASAVVIVALVADHIWIAHHPPIERFFYTDGKGTPYEITPLDQPVMSEAELLMWTVKSITASYNVNFSEYREQLTRAAAHFTVRGWNSFGAEYIHSLNFEKMKEARLVVTAVPERAPTIRDQAVIDGKKTYKIEAPIVVTYENENGHRDQRLLVTVIVVRMPVADHPDGIAIDQINAPPV
jgi:intracellular multiplication protein IcmL